MTGERSHGQGKRPESAIEMGEKSSSASLQDRFLNHIRREKTPVTMFLVKGVKLQGIATWFDAFSLLLRRDGQSQLVYKHAISTIMPVPTFDVDAFIAEVPKPGAGTGLQDQFLSAVERSEEAATIFLVNGVMLQGHLSAFDQFCLLLRRDRAAQLVYKHAISTVQPSGPIQIGGEEAVKDA